MSIRSNPFWFLTLAPSALAACAGCAPDLYTSAADAGLADVSMADAPAGDAGVEAVDAAVASRRDGGRDRRDGGTATSDAATSSDDAGLVACTTDADCTGEGTGICDDGVCAHIAECPVAVERASCTERSTTARWCIGGHNKMAKLSRLLCTEDRVSVRIFDVGAACEGTSCAAGRVCEARLTGTGRGFCGAPCAADSDCPAGDTCLSFSTGAFCGHPIGGVEDVFCSTTNVDQQFGPAFAAPRFFDASGLPLTIRGDLQEVLDLDPSAACP